MKRKKGNKTGKNGADKGNCSSKELKLSLASEGSPVRNLALQSNTSKVTLKRLGVNMRKNIEPSITVRRGRSRVDSDTGGVCVAAEGDNLRKKSGVRSKLEHNESKLIAGQILNDLIDSN